jgi:hypothetical protein
MTRRIILAFLICLLPLQSFAGGVMSAKMAGMESTMAVESMPVSQDPCHTASQIEQPASQDCCGLQGVCQALCHLIAVLPVLVTPAAFSSSIHPLVAFAASFESADLGVGFKPPLL